MFKNEIKTLKQHVNAHHKIKASLSKTDLMLHVDFTEIYKNDQQHAIQSVYFWNHCFAIFTAAATPKFLITTMLEMTMLSLLTKVATTIESHL